MSKENCRNLGDKRAQLENTLGERYKWTSAQRKFKRSQSELKMFLKVEQHLHFIYIGIKKLSPFRSNIENIDTKMYLDRI